LPSVASVVSFALFKRLLFFFQPVSGLWIGGLIHLPQVCTCGYWCSTLFRVVGFLNYLLRRIVAVFKAVVGMASLKMLSALSFLTFSFANRINKIYIRKHVNHY